MGTSLVGSCRPHASPPSLAGPYPGQGAWGWAQSPAIQLLLSHSEFNKSVCPPFVGVDILTAKGASFMVWACVCLGTLLSRFLLIPALVGQMLREWLQPRP